MPRRRTHIRWTLASIAGTCASKFLGAVDIRAIGEMPELEILHCLAYAVDCARYWEPPDEDDLIFVRPEVIAALRPIAKPFSDSSHTAWWTEPADLLNQHLVEKRNPIYGWSDSPVRIYRTKDGLEQWRAEALATERQFLEYQNADPDRHIGGEWWSTHLPTAQLKRPGLATVSEPSECFSKKTARRTRLGCRPVRIHGTPPHL